MTNIPDGWLRPTQPIRLHGPEKFIGIDAQVSDFWAFALGDLRMNIVRGYLAEFLVARALNLKENKVEWTAYDLEWKQITIEVKSTGYLQSWGQKSLSRSVFGGLQGRIDSPLTGFAPEPTFNADVYVFCVQTATKHEDYKPLDVSQWEFYVASKWQVSEARQKSLTLKKVKQIAGDKPLTIEELPGAITSAKTI
jgi:hypothetical protein